MHYFIRHYMSNREVKSVQLQELKTWSFIIRQRLEKLKSEQKTKVDNGFYG